MKTTTLFSVFLITGIILAGCGAGVPVNTATPVNTPTPENTATPVYTPTPRNITNADLTNITLKTEDLPVGIHRFTEDEIKSIGFNFKALAEAYGLSPKLVKLDVYGENPQRGELLIIEIFYPMSAELVTQIAAVISYPGELAKLSIDDVKMLPNLSGIGNGSIGLSGILNKMDKVNVLFIYQNNTVILIMDTYQSETSIFDLKAIGQKIDQYVLAEYK